MGIKSKVVSRRAQKSTKSRMNKTTAKLIVSRKLSGTKFFRDPIHDLIRIESDVILSLIDTAPMQRMKRIRQLGLASFVFPGAEHSRFTHSLGVLHMATRLLNQLNVVDEYDRLLVQVSALLHDVGHGPFSHLFEEAIAKLQYKHFESHEIWTQKIVMEHEEMGRILDSVHSQLKVHVCEVISNTHRPAFLAAIVSSQFDADRLDYMLRDSYMTGVHYGRYDLNWILRNLSVAPVTKLDPDNVPYPEDEIVINGSRGLSSLEDYLLGNYYLYKHVYYHRTIQSAEGLLVKILIRAVNVLRSDRQIGVSHPVLTALAKQRAFTLDDYLSLSDNVIWSWITTWASKKYDKILYDFATAFLNRKLFKVIDVSHLSHPDYLRMIDRARGLLVEKKLDPEYYLILKEPSRQAYKDIFRQRNSKKLSQEVYFTDNKGEPQPFSGVPEGEKIARALLAIGFHESYIIVPDSIVSPLKETLSEIGHE